MIELHVPSFTITKRFYRDLGFKVVWERRSTKREKGYLVMQRGDSILNFYCGDDRVFGQSYFRKFPRSTPRGYATEVVIPIAGIALFYSEVIAKHRKLIVGRLCTRYSKPDFRMVDPFGFYLRFVERYDWVHGRDRKGNKLPQLAATQ